MNQKVYVVMFRDFDEATIESVWDDPTLAQIALKRYAEEAKTPERFYRIVERRLNILKYNG